MSYEPIEEYAAIGDCRCLALISRSGSIDWLCLPRFDSQAVFSAILDHQRGGRFAVRPAAVAEIERAYIDETNVLQTIFWAESGVLRLTDFMPVTSRLDYRRSLWPERHVVRIAECLEGQVEMEAIYAPRPHFGRTPPDLSEVGRLGLRCQHQGHMFNLQSSFPLQLDREQHAAYGRSLLAKGDKHYFSFTYAEQGIAVIPPMDDALLQNKLRKTISWWRQWASRCTYEGLHRDAVLRSLLVLKLLTYSPSGAVVAAPTTSLPEIVGGTRNWDYRYCWLRDAAMTIRAFLNLGYTREAEAFLSWLLHSTKLSRPKLRVLYSIYGETSLQESEIAYLEGYRRSAPVRVGNGAYHQLQLDVYGEVIQGAFEIARRKRTFERSTRRMLRNLGKTVCRLWREPDFGIWEIRSAPRHITHSKVMCWISLQRLIELHEQGKLKVPLRRFTQERDAIRAEIEKHGYDCQLDSYVSYFGSQDVDISLLFLPIHGYIDAGDRRIKGTCEHIRRTLARGGLFQRFPFGFDGIREGEGLFAIAVFLAAGVLALRGEIDEALEKFEEALAYANDVGLYGEEIDGESGGALGNFPQAYTHVGLINAAMILDRVQAEIGRTSGHIGCRG